MFQQWLCKHVYALIVFFNALTLSICFTDGIQITVDDNGSDYYMAGVVEFRPIMAGMTSAQMVEEHLQAYLDIINSSEAVETDIIVFPEGTLNNLLQLTFVPPGDERIIPCENSSTNMYAEFLKSLSCAAQNTKKYLVINLTEKENCTENHLDKRPCAANGLNVYNTNVVFDRNGRVISRYRKWNLFMEQKNTTLYPEIAVFDTDFGVRFGHFICFDMIFYRPAQELIRKHRIQNIIYPTLYFSELPFLTAVQLQQSWSWGNNVNVLAAGASHPQAGTTGTGIYVGNNGELLSLMVTNTGVRKLLVAKVPKNINQPGDFISRKRDETAEQIHQEDINILQFPNIVNFTSMLVKIEVPVFTQRLCHNALCCTFYIDTQIAKSELTTHHSSFNYLYRIGVYNGRRTYLSGDWNYVQICALYACLNESVTSCGLLASRDTTYDSFFIFNNIRIEGDFEKHEQLLLMPTTVNNQLYSLNDTFIEWNAAEMKQSYKTTIALRQPAANLLTFGIYANYYDRSGAKYSWNMDGKYPLMVLLMVLIFLIKYHST